MDLYLLEAIINGILLGGVLALLALGLNLIFGVIDVVWIAYADIVMCGMYVIYFLYVEYGVPLPLACLIAIVSIAALGVVVHLLIIAPVLNSAPHQSAAGHRRAAFLSAEFRHAPVRHGFPQYRRSSADTRDQRHSTSALHG